jgi:DNA-binding transcriptional MerR regulator
LRTIGEVVEETGVAAHVLRYWERQVTALRPVRRAGDRRYYRAEDVALIGEIARLINHEGYTLEGAARAASGRKRQPVAQMDPAAAATSTQPALFASLTGGAQADGAISLARLRNIRDQLQDSLKRNA